MGAVLDGFYGDCAVTVPVGPIAPDAVELLRVTEEALFRGIDAVKPGARVSDIGAAVQRHVEAHGFSVVREFVGHGIGTSLHEEPQIANYGPGGKGPRLAEGMVLAIEPMVNAGRPEVQVLVGRVDGRDAGPEPVGALRAHGGGVERRLRDPDACSQDDAERAKVHDGSRRPALSGRGSVDRWPRRKAWWRRSCRAGCMTSTSMGVAVTAHAGGGLGPELRSVAGGRPGRRGVVAARPDAGPNRAEGLREGTDEGTSVGAADL